MRWRAKPLICFGLSYVVFVSSACKNAGMTMTKPNQAKPDKTNEIKQDNQSKYHNQQTVAQSVGPSAICLYFNSASIRPKCESH